MADDNQAVNAAMMAGNMYGPNPYTRFQGRLPPTTYRGMPTDASGRPIQPPPGTTLNQTAATPPQAQAGGQTYGLQPSDLAAPSALNPSGNLAFGMANWGGMMSPQAQQLYANQQFAPPGSARGTTYANSGGMSHPMASAMDPSLGQGGGDTSYQNALDLLSNPGNIETKGANVPASKPVTQQPSVLDQFLQSQKGGTGAGGYSNQSFFDTLNKLRPQAGTIA